MPPFPILKRRFLQKTNRFFLLLAVCFWANASWAQVDFSEEKQSALNQNLSFSNQKLATADYQELYRIKFPDDVVIYDLNELFAPTTVPKIFGDDVEMVSATIASADPSNLIFPECVRFYRVWEVVNSTTHNPNNGPIVIPHPANTSVGPTVWIGNGWAIANPNALDVPTVAPKTLDANAPLNLPGTPAYRFTQIVKFYDTIAPTVQPFPINALDFTQNDPVFWNNQVFAGANGEADQPETPVELSIEAADSNYIYANATLFLDLDHDGQQESTIHAFEWGSSVNLLNVAPFENTPTHQFIIKKDVLGGGKFKAHFGWKNTMTGDFEPAQLPLGSHKIRWQISDRCGNERTVEQSFEVKDGLAPSLVCADSLFLQLPNSCETMVSTATFLQSASDNYSSFSNLDFSLRLKGNGTGFPTDINGNTIETLSIDCSMNSPVFIETWCRDEAGNTSFCTSRVFLSKPCLGAGDIQQDSICKNLKNRDVPLNPSCKITVPNLAAEVVVNPNCLPDLAWLQNPTAGSFISKKHNETQVVSLQILNNLTGKMAVCPVVLTAKDTTRPIILNCSTAPTTVSMASNCQITVPNFAAGTFASDNCSTITKTQKPNAGTKITVKHNQLIPIEITAKDAAGNLTVCKRTLRAADQTKPTISVCPPPRSVALDAACKLVVPNLTAELVGKDCSVPLLVVQNPSAGTLLASANGQTHTVILAATDQAGNSKTCSVVLTGIGAGCLETGYEARFSTKKEEKWLEMQAIPNPFADELTISFDLETASTAQVVLMDLTGRRLFFEKVNALEAGRQSVVFHTAALPDGLFLAGLKVENRGWVFRKILKNGNVEP